MDKPDYGHGNGLAAIGMLLACFASAILVAAVVNTEWVIIVVVLGAWGAAVLIGAMSLRRRVPQGYRVSGLAGLPPFAWAIGVLLLAGVTVPVYFFQRPRIRRAYEIGSQTTGGPADVQ
jgi:Flp pilus assembly protein TadB